MRKVFQVETRNTGVLWGLTGGLLISLLLFLILPFTQKLSGSNPKNLLLKVDVSLPRYPPKLLLNRVSGRVDLLIVIDEEGRVTDHQVRRFTHNEFKREVTRVIRQWKFSPAMKDGRKVAVRKIQPFYFGKQ